MIADLITSAALLGGGLLGGIAIGRDLARAKADARVVLAQGMERAAADLAFKFSADLAEVRVELELLQFDYHDALDSRDAWRSRAHAAEERLPERAAPPIVTLGPPMRVVPPEPRP